MSVTQSDVVTTCKLLVDGKWIESTATEYGDIANPSTGEIIGKVPMCSAKDVDLAVQAAQKAFPAWRDTPIVERARVMFKFKNLLEEHYEEIARIVTREHGKTFIEAKASVQRGIEVVEFACGIPSLFYGESMSNIATNVDAETIRFPLGVCAGITPFNFPAMVPLWMYPIALTCGNTFVLKPSEKVPLSSIYIAELLKQAGLPDGVFNIVQWRQRLRERHFDSPSDQSYFVRGLYCDRQIRLRDRHRERQACASSRRREESHHHHA